MQSALTVCGIDNPVIDAWKEATKWRQNHAWTWTTGNEPWFAILQNTSIGLRTRGYIGLIYADGDRVGQRIATLKTVDTYADFANKLSLAAEEAVFTIGINLRT